MKVTNLREAVNFFYGSDYGSMLNSTRSNSKFHDVYLKSSRELFNEIPFVGQIGHSSEDGLVTNFFSEFNALDSNQHKSDKVEELLSIVNKLNEILKTSDAENNGKTLVFASSNGKYIINFSVKLYCRPNDSSYQPSPLNLNLSFEADSYNDLVKNSNKYVLFAKELIEKVSSSKLGFWLFDISNQSIINREFKKIREELGSDVVDFTSSGGKRGGLFVGGGFKSCINGGLFIRGYCFKSYINGGLFTRGGLFVRGDYFATIKF